MTKGRTRIRHRIATAFVGLLASMSVLMGALPASAQLSGEAVQNDTTCRCVTEAQFGDCDVQGSPMNKAECLALEGHLCQVLTNCGNGGGGTTRIENPLGPNTTVQDILGRVIRAFTTLSGVVALLMFITGGMLWLTSGGNQNRIDQGRKAMLYAGVGLFIIFAAYAFLNFLFGALGAGV